MEARKTIRGYVPDVDPERFGLSLAAVIAIRISQGKLLETHKKISEDPRVAAVYDVTGEWDSLLVGHFRDRADLNRFIKDLLAQRYVDRSVTHIVLNVVKEERRVPV
jgi:DNA-binding Lrp family transcriptional regulator